MPAQGHNAFQRRLEERRQAREASERSRQVPDDDERQMAMTRFRKQCQLLGEIRSQGLRFAAGGIPTAEDAFRIGCQGRGAFPCISLSIDTRRQLVIGVTLRDGGLVYYGHILEMQTKHSLHTSIHIDAFAEWLADQVSLYEYHRNRQANLPATAVRNGMPPSSPPPTGFRQTPEEGGDEPEDLDVPGNREHRAIDLNG